jgi:hypothetical protein
MTDSDEIARIRRGIPELVERAEWLLNSTVGERMNAGVDAEDIIADLVKALRAETRIEAPTASVRALAHPLTSRTWRPSSATSLSLTCGNRSRASACCVGPTRPMNRTPTPALGVEPES